mgnify:CR=1 FL=1
MKMANKLPLISIVMATYNSSHLLKYSIGSLLDSDFDNWELIVIGDCCTDNTEDVIHSFNDDRIRFLNLEENSGQQARPNNIGLSMTKGRYVAFLNQDDMLYPSHLTACIQEIQSSDSDMLVIPGLVVKPSTKKSLEHQKFEVNLDSVHVNGKYSPKVFSVASSWFMKKEIIPKVGPWKMENEVYCYSSQEWLYRAWKTGVAMHFPSRVGLLIIYSGPRGGIHKKSMRFEHEYFYNKISDTSFQKALMEKAAIHATKDINTIAYYSSKKMIRVVVDYLIDTVARVLSIHPVSLKRIMKGRKKGSLIQKNRV